MAPPARPHILASLEPHEKGLTGGQPQFGLEAAWSVVLVMPTIVPVSRPNVEVQAWSIAVVAAMMPIVAILPIPAVHLLHFVFTHGPQAIQSSDRGGLARHCDESECGGTSRDNQPVAKLHRSVLLELRRHRRRGVINRRTASECGRSNEVVGPCPSNSCVAASVRDAGKHNQQPPTLPVQCLVRKRRAAPQGRQPPRIPHQRHCPTTVPPIPKQLLPRMALSLFRRQPTTTGFHLRPKRQTSPQQAPNKRLNGAPRALPSERNP